MEKNSLGQKIAYLRMCKGLSQRELATILGVSLTVVNKWEKDTVKPNPRNIGKLSKVLGCNPAVLVDLL